MVGRGRSHRQSLEGVRRRHRAPVTGPYVGGPFHRQPHSAALEEELEFQMMSIRRLLSDNRGLAEDRATSHQELVSAKEELKRMNLVIADIQAEKHSHTRELSEKISRLEADLRDAEPMRDEVILLREGINKLTAMRQELMDQVQSLTRNLTRAQADNKRIPAMKAEFDGLHKELNCLRMSIEYERKGNFELMEERKSMEKSLVSMEYEIKKLQTDLAKNGGGSRGASGVPGMNVGSLAVPYSSRYVYEHGIDPPVAGKTTLHGAGSGSWGVLDKSHLARH